MKLLFLDFETYYDTAYSLRKMTPVEYILDHRFESIGVALKEELDGKAFWLPARQLAGYLKSNDLSKTKIISHNALFDMSILAWQFDFIPYFMIDTLSMARAKLSHIAPSLSLAALAKHFEIGTKGDAIFKVQGLSAEGMKEAGLYDDLVAYALNDVEICAQIYQMLQPFPAAELAICDMVQRCAIQPRLVLDQTILSEHLHIVRANKETLLQRAGLTDREELMSNDKFAEALRHFGVSPPQKISPVTGKVTWAFSKTDPQFMALDEHYDPLVQALVAARIGMKSTLEETRTQKFISIGNLQWPNRALPLMPIPLRYSGAHTHRLSGDWGLNLQNLPRGGALRNALIAPKGSKIITCDSAQIEARMVAWFSGQKNLVEQFAKGEDVYSSFASEVFNQPINKKDHPVQRFMGKTAVLGLGYGMGADKFEHTVRTQSRAQLGSEIEISKEQAQSIVNVYRSLYSEIPAMWTRLNRLLNKMTDHRTSEFIGPVTPSHAGTVYITRERITLPSGLSLFYRDLRQGNDNWVFDYGRTKSKKIFGGKLLENIIQALARIVVMDAALRLRTKLKPYDIHLTLQVHDELAYVVPDQYVDVVKQMILKEMCTPPSWAPDLPLSAETGVGQSYGEAK
jgi:DNA polymerase